MAGNTRFDLSIAIPKELAFKDTFPNGQRVSLMNGNLDRSASFRVGNEGQIFISSAAMSRGDSTSMGYLAPLAQCLMLDPITMGDKKSTTPGELRRALGVSCGNTLEDFALETSNPKPLPPVAKVGLKQFKATVQEISVRARLDESLHKLNKCREALNSEKQFINEKLPNERVGGSHFSKMRSQTQRSPSAFVNQRLEDRPKNVVLNKRIRTSVANIQGEGQSNSFLRQSMAIGKDRDVIKDGGKGCAIVEEKIRKLPAGGETWDRKMRRKCSMATVFARSIDSEGELKSVMHPKLANEIVQSSEAQDLRSGYSRSNSKLDVASMPAISNSCATSRDDQEKVSRDSMGGSNKDGILKPNKLNVGDNNYKSINYSLSKGKASRAPRTGPLMAGNSSSEALGEAFEQPSNVNKPHSVSGTINPQRPLPSGSAYSPIAKWVGQRPQKISRTRRKNVVSPVLSCDEVHMSFEGCSPSDVATKMTSTAASGSLISNGTVCTQLNRVKHESVSSQARLSESEGLGAGENGEIKLKEKRLGSDEVDERAINYSYNISSSLLAMKNKMYNKEVIGEDLSKQGKISRDSAVLKTGITPMNEKLENPTLSLPIRSVKPGFGKNGSKSRLPPLKKSCNRKAISCLGHPSASHSPDIAGELDDDQEELLAAANFASNASYIGCSSSFWKNQEPNFAPVNLEDIAYLKQQVKSIEEDQRCLPQMLGLGSDSLDGRAHKDYPLARSPLSRERERSAEQTDSKEMSSTVDIVDQHLDLSFLCRQMDSEGIKAAPLYQRVLTALIIDDQTDEEPVGGGEMSFPCEIQDVENKSRMGEECEFKSDMFSCNGNATHDRELDDFLQVLRGPLHPETERLPIVSEYGSGGSVAMHKISSFSPSFNRHFEQMSVEGKLLLELQSVGLYPEQVPDLADGDCEAINQDIIQLQKGLKQQVIKKREYFVKLIQAVEEGREKEQRSLQQVAMDKLVESAYKKKLGTRGSRAARNGIPKISGPIALAFMKRTLTRCRKFEETGRSCFLEPVFKDALFAAPACDNYAGSAVAVNLPLAQNAQPESTLPGLIPCRKRGVLGKINHPSDLDFTRTGPIVNRGKKKELLLDDIGGGLGSASTIGNSGKGKRSERERDKGTSGRNSVAKAGRSSADHSMRGERNTKAKPKQKAARLSTSGNGSPSKLTDNENSKKQLACGSDEGKAGSSSPVSNKTKDLSIPAEQPMDLTNLHELDSIAVNELNGHQDLDAWLINIDEDDLQDEDVVGLDIPMDDLSALNIVP